jgi:hypothetical protein
VDCHQAIFAGILGSSTAVRVPKLQELIPAKVIGLESYVVLEYVNLYVKNVCSESSRSCRIKFLQIIVALYGGTNVLVSSRSLYALSICNTRTYRIL